MTSSTYTLYCPATGRDRIKEDANYVICIIYYKLQIEWLPFTLLTFIYFAAAAERCELKYLHLHCSIKVSDRVTLGCHLSSVIHFILNTDVLPLITASHPAHCTPIDRKNFKSAYILFSPILCADDFTIFLHLQIIVRQYADQGRSLMMVILNCKKKE